MASTAVLDITRSPLAGFQTANISPDRRAFAPPSTMGDSSRIASRIGRNCDAIDRAKQAEREWSAWRPLMRRS
jgi:hypothetical protein